MTKRTDKKEWRKTWDISINQNYDAVRHRLPEKVLLEGFRDILYSFDVHLDDYDTRKLLYTLLVGIGYFVYNYPETYIRLEGMDIYRDDKRKNVFTLNIIDHDYYKKGVTVQTLYDYFIGGGMDYEELGKQLDQYALSFISYTQREQTLARKAYKSWHRFQLIKKDLKEAKRILAAMDLPTNAEFIRQISQVAKLLKEDRRDEFLRSKGRLNPDGTAINTKKLDKNNNT